MVLSGTTATGIEHDKLTLRAQAKPKVGPTGLPRHLSIFLLEDDVELLTIFARVLIGAGFFVTSSQLAEYALAALTTTRPVDLVITDLVLPGMDGTEFCAKVAELRPGTPFIVMTGSDTVIDLAQFPPNTTAIYKPFRRQEVMKVVLSKLGLSEVPAGAADSPAVW